MVTIKPKKNYGSLQWKVISYHKNRMSKPYRYLIPIGPG